MQAAKRAGLVTVRELKEGERFLPDVLVGLRRLSTVAHTPLSRVGVALDIAYQILTGELPKEDCQVGDRIPTQVLTTYDLRFTAFLLTAYILLTAYYLLLTLAMQAVQKLGELDRRRNAAENAASTEPACINTDTGNDFCEREVGVVATWDSKQGR